MPLNPCRGLETLYSYFGTDHGQSFRTGSAKDLIRGIRDGDLECAEAPAQYAPGNRAPPIGHEEVWTRARGPDLTDPRPEAVASTCSPKSESDSWHSWTRAHGPNLVDPKPGPIQSTFLNACKRSLQTSTTTLAPVHWRQRIDPLK